MSKWKEISSDLDKYFKKYGCYISSHDSKRVSDKDFAILAKEFRQT